MRKISAYIADLPLKRKLLLIVLAADILAFVGITLIGLNWLMQKNNELLYEATAESLSYSAKDIERALNNIERLSYLLVTDEDVQTQLNSLNAGGDTQSRATAYRLLTNVLLRELQQFKDDGVYCLSVYEDSMSTHSDTSRANKLEQAKANKIIEAGKNGDGYPVWISDYCGENGLFLARAVRRIRPFNLKQIGVAVICVDLDRLVANSTASSSSYGKNQYVLFSENSLLSVSEGLPESIMAIVGQIPPESYRIIDMGDRSFFAVRSGFGKKGWQYVSFVPYDGVQSAIELSQLIFCAVMIVCFVLSMLICGLLVGRVTVHLDALVARMKLFSENETEFISSDYDYSQRRDEIGVLHRQFEFMNSRIVNYIQNDYVNKLLIKETQIKALENQIDPHFLYNVLASINWRAKAIGAEKISIMVQALGKLLRATLSRDEENFTLEQETQLVRNYLTIQQLRYEDKLQYSMNIPAELLSAQIPRFSIQPLVENAIRYGLEQSTEGCVIEIEAAKERDTLKITVKNTDSRFEDDMLTRIETGDIQPRGFGIGMSNIQKRIKLIFGDAYGLEVCNEDEYAVVRVRVPYTQNRREGGE